MSSIDTKLLHCHRPPTCLVSSWINWTYKELHVGRGARGQAAELKLIQEQLLRVNCFFTFLLDIRGKRQ